MGNISIRANTLRHIDVLEAKNYQPNSQYIPNQTKNQNKKHTNHNHNHNNNIIVRLRKDISQFEMIQSHIINGENQYKKYIAKLLEQCFDNVLPWKDVSQDFLTTNKLINNYGKYSGIDLMAINNNNNERNNKHVKKSDIIFIQCIRNDYNGDHLCIDDIRMFYRSMIMNNIVGIIICPNTIMINSDFINFANEAQCKYRPKIYFWNIPFKSDDNIPNTRPWTINRN